MFSERKAMADTDFDTLVGEKTKISGDIEFTGGLHIDGRIEGTIKSKDLDSGLLVISEKGVVEGEIHVPSVVIDGRLKGDVVASQKIELRKNAIVDGDVRYGSIQMEMGAQVNGTLTSDKESGRKSTAPVADGTAKKA